MADGRRRVSEKLAAEVMFEADCVCCICQRAERRLQIHHIDGDRSNSSKDNLAALCLECHDRISVAGGTGRRLGPSLVRKYKEDWLSVVERKRSKRLPHEPVTSPVSDDKLIEAVAVVEVRKIAYSVPGVPGSWAGVAEHISLLADYGRDFGATVKSGRSP